MAATQPKKENSASQSAEYTRSAQHRESTDSAYGSGPEDEEQYSYRRADGSERPLPGDFAYWSDGTSGDDKAAAMMKDYEKAQARVQRQTTNPERTREVEYVGYKLYKPLSQC